MNEITQSVDEHAKSLEAFRVKMQPEAVDASISATKAKLRADFHGHPPASTEAGVERDARIKYDEDLRTKAAQLERDDDDIDRAIDTAIKTVGLMPNPLRALANAAMSDDRRDLAHLRCSAELDRAERRIQGRQPEEIQVIYEAADDTHDHALVWLIEDKVARKELAFPEPLELEMRLPKTIAARVRARVQKEHPYLLEAQERHRKNRSATIDTYFRHLRGGKGVAYLERRMGVLTIEPDARGLDVRRRTAAMI